MININKVRIIKKTSFLIIHIYIYIYIYIEIFYKIMADKVDNADNADKVEKIDKDKIDYNTDLEYLLKIHAEECESFSILHRYSYEKYNER